MKILIKKKSNEPQKKEKDFLQSFLVAVSWLFENFLSFCKIWYGNSICIHERFACSAGVLYRRVNAKKLANAFAPPPLPSPSSWPSLTPLVQISLSPSLFLLWKSKIAAQDHIKPHPLQHRYNQKNKKYRPFVPWRVVLTVIVNFSMDSSTEKLYRRGVVFFTLRFLLCPGLEPILRVLVPSSTPAVRLFSFSSSPSFLREIVWPEVRSARSLKAGWRWV